MLSEQQIAEMEAELFGKCADVSATLRTVLEEAAPFADPGVLMCLVHAISSVGGVIHALADEPGEGDEDGS